MLHQQGFSLKNTLPGIVLLPVPIPLSFPSFSPFFITLPLIPILNAIFRKVLKPEDAGVVTTPECSDPVAQLTRYTETGNFHSPGIEGSQGLIRQVPLNLVPLESYGQGK